jgi:hypothetical protein
MARISVRIAPEHLEMVDAWAVERHATRSQIVRGLVLAALDAGQTPEPMPTRRQARERELDDLIARLNAAARS